MTTFLVAAPASGAVAWIAVTTISAAKTPVRSDRSFLDDARWAPRSWSGNRRASLLPERRGWGRGDGGTRAVDGEARERGAKDVWRAHRPRGGGDHLGSVVGGPGGNPP